LPSVSPDDPAAVWSALLEATRSQAALGWMDLYRLNALDPHDRGLTASISPIRSGDFARRSASPERLARLGELLGQIVQKPVVVKLVQADHSANPAPTDRPASAGSTVDRDSAYRMPAVREVLDVFPDAIVVSVKKSQSEQDQ
jgi:hypothetical protein